MTVLNLMSKAGSYQGLGRDKCVCVWRGGVLCVALQGMIRQKYPGTARVKRAVVHKSFIKFNEYTKKQSFTEVYEIHSKSL